MSGAGFVVFIKRLPPSAAYAALVACGNHAANRISQITISLARRTKTKSPPGYERTFSLFQIIIKA